MSKFIRLNITAEGQTEERFVKETLSPHLGNFNLSTDIRCVLTSKDKQKKYRGGLISYQKAKFDIITWLKTDKHNETRFTTMFDLYALPDDFPGYNEAIKLSDPYMKVEVIEQALKADIDDWRFIPYIQLHEFEALLFTKPSELELEYFHHKAAIQALENILQQFRNNPELINDRSDFAPSKRIIQLIPEYEGNKVNVGAVIAGIIGIDKLKQSCSHFRNWVEQLEKLS